MCFKTIVEVLFIIQFSDIVIVFLDSPFLMTSLQTSPTGVGGVAWLVPDHKCRLHYQIILSGLQDYSSLNALLVGDFDSKSASNNKNAIYTLFIPNFINGMVRPLKRFPHGHKNRQFS